MPTVGATGSMGRLASNTLNLYNPSCRANFNSYPGRSSETGFTANLRPAVYYRPSLDNIDNPPFGLLLSDSFMSQAKQDYQPHIPSDCSGSLPNIINKPRESGFHQLRSHSKMVTTEYQRSFVPHCLTPTVSQHHVVVGPKQESGFTEGTDLQLNTFQDIKGCMVEPRQIHSSVMKSDFMAPSFLQGTEARPGLCSLSSRETGFTRGAIAPLAWPTSLLPSPQTKSNALIVKTIGKKEPSGFLLNAPSHQAFPNSPFDCSHFTTHYNSTFCHRTQTNKLHPLSPNMFIFRG
uniref:Stabilizer of axonemal microtubules 4 n=1 Tax=Dicentrarchus labrax TaxID=13489 RepID=A0A8C4F4G6_DICLA